MRWSPEPLSIGPRDGFDKTDIFGFKPFGERLANLVGAFEDDPVVLLDGPWGSGKTTFVTQWAGVLRQQGHAVLYLDAFASDHYGEPFLALVEEVHRVATEEDLDVDRNLVDRFEKGAAAAAKELGFTALALLSPALGLAAEAVRTAAMKSGTHADLLHRWLEDAGARRKAVRDFRDSLGALAKECAGRASRLAPKLSDGAVVPVLENPRLVCVVDELDRCRPAFAVAMLERIKHIFGVKGVVFVLVANVAELGKSIQREYGSIDSEKYLEKFYEIRARLPEKTDFTGSFTSKRYVNHLANGHQLLMRDGQALALHRRILGGIAEMRRLSLRTAEHILRNVLVLAAAGSHYGDSPRLCAVVCATRVLEPGLFRKLVEARPCLLEESERELLADMIDPAGRDREEARSYVDRNLGKYGELPDLARVLDGFGIR